MDQNKKIILTLSTLLLGLIFALQAIADTVQRSNFIVNNLSCTSCLATIEAELKGVPGTLGMDADIRSGRVTVDHLSTLDYAYSEYFRLVFGRRRPSGSRLPLRATLARRARLARRFWTLSCHQ